MAVVNVNREVDDQFYRYKMPKIIAKVEGKGNGIKTVIVNMPEVAKALDRPTTYPCKYFGCELGAQVQFDSKNDRYIVNGSHESTKLQDLLDGFIKKFVLCPSCDNPETKLVVKKQMIVQRCAACGNQADIDMRHKFTTYILKNPPNQDQNSATPSKKQSKKEKKKGSDSAESPEAGQGDTNGQLTPPDNGFEDDDVDWGEDVSKTAVQRRLDEISGAARSMTLSDDLEKTQTERINMLYEFVKQRKSNITSTAEKEIVGESERLDVKEKAPLILAELLYDQHILTQIKQYRTLFLRFTHENGKAQKYLLGGFELLVGNVHKDVLLPKVPHILKQFYDCDILDEEIIIDWGKKASKKYVSKEVSAQIHAKAAPFITWLSQAEEESSDDEAEGLEVDFSATGKVGTVVVKETPAACAAQADDTLDDEDIDDI